MSKNTCGNDNYNKSKKHANMSFGTWSTSVLLYSLWTCLVSEIVAYSPRAAMNKVRALLILYISQGKFLSLLNVWRNNIYWSDNANAGNTNECPKSHSREMVTKWRYYLGMNAVVFCESVTSCLSGKPNTKNALFEKTQTTIERSGDNTNKGPKSHSR